jgi:Leucine-rich repeat (LRR) protein
VDAHLAKLPKLRCLRLRFNSYDQSKLTLKEFKNLEYLLVESSKITGIVYEDEAASNLKKMVWSFTSMETLSGLDKLPMLRELEFNGSNVPHEVREAVEAHPNHTLFLHNPFQSVDSLR